MAKVLMISKYQTHHPDPLTQGSRFMPRLTLKLLEGH